MRKETREEMRKEMREDTRDNARENTREKTREEMRTKLNLIQKDKSPDCKTINIIAKYHGVAKSVEKVVKSQNGGPMVGSSIPPHPGLTISRRKNASSIVHVKT